ncbi:MAG TPA: type II secretion system minor pseudopilin GspI [Burkholderiales bacterium]|nr:type II secretion system minor pseudopilin GspI [Burkholderiales bacterium]
MNALRRAARGFTLVEILVALAVLAIALVAVAQSLGAAADTTAALRDRTLARWVAEDRLAELELRRQWPSLDVTEGDSEMGGRAFHWRQETQATPVARMRRIEVSVFFPKSALALARLTGFVEQSAASVSAGLPQAVIPAEGTSQTGPGVGSSR